MYVHSLKKHEITPAHPIKRVVPTIDKTFLHATSHAAFRFDHAQPPVLLPSFGASKISSTLFIRGLFPTSLQAFSLTEEHQEKLIQSYLQSLLSFTFLSAFPRTRGVTSPRTPSASTSRASTWPCLACPTSSSIWSVDVSTHKKTSAPLHR